jgi:hypothetical protein
LPAKRRRRRAAAKHRAGADEGGFAREVGIAGWIGAGSGGRACAAGSGLDDQCSGIDRDRPARPAEFQPARDPVQASRPAGDPARCAHSGARFSRAFGCRAAVARPGAAACKPATGTPTNGLARSGSDGAASRQAYSNCEPAADGIPADPDDSHCSNPARANSSGSGGDGACAGARAQAFDPPLARRRTRARRRDAVPALAPPSPRSLCRSVVRPVRPAGAGAGSRPRTGTRARSFPASESPDGRFFSIQSTRCARWRRILATPACARNRDAAAALPR